MSLSVEILKIIDEKGYIPLDEYITLCMSHEEYGYYRRHDPLGRAGDFITAPEISQLFGEMIGIWLVLQWKYFGCPHTLHLCELGPGRGTLMQDILRVAKKTPSFKAAVKVFFIEQNETLIEMQKERVPDATWLTHLDDIPTDQTLIIIANEFFDALPVMGYRFNDNQWTKAVIKRDESGLPTLDLVWISCDENDVPERLRINFEYTFEISPLSELVMQMLADKIKQAGGCGLFIDYGYSLPPNDLTVRGYSNHRVVDCTDRPGQIDITADVDFMMLSRVALGSGCIPMPLMSQRDFLGQMGIKKRCEVLLNMCEEEDKSYNLLSGVQKLIDVEEMGERFKVLCIISPQAVTPWPFTTLVDDASRPDLQKERELEQEMQVQQEQKVSHETGTGTSTPAKKPIIVKTTAFPSRSASQQTASSSSAKPMPTKPMPTKPMPTKTMGGQRTGIQNPPSVKPIGEKSSDQTQSTEKTQSTPLPSKPLSTSVRLPQSRPLPKRDENPVPPPPKKPIGH